LLIFYFSRLHGHQTTAAVDAVVGLTDVNLLHTKCQ